MTGGQRPRTVAWRARAAVLALMAWMGVPAEPAASQTFVSEQHRFAVSTLVEDLEHPWGLAFLPDGGFLVTERPGRLRVCLLYTSDAADE